MKERQSEEEKGGRDREREREREGGREREREREREGTDFKKDHEDGNLIRGSEEREFLN